jgi:transposase
MNRKDMLDVYNQGPEAVIAVWTKLLDTISMLTNEVAHLRLRVEELEAQVKKNSKNSHKPPSSDEFNKPKPKSLRQKNRKKPGGQKGHAGHMLSPVEDPDHIIIHRVTDCTSCGHSLEHAPVRRKETRQVFDLPPLQIEVTQHEAEVKMCPHCQTIHTASFPDHVQHHVQYGPRLKAIAVYLTQYQLLPYERTSELIRDLFGQPISEGTLVTMNNDFCEKASFFEEEIYQALLRSPVVHFDETGIRVKGKRHWLHSASTKDATAYFIHPKRGKEAMDDANLLPQYKGVAVHDAWAPYFRYDECSHALCNVHHLRELQGIWELHQQVWAKDMMDFLLSAKQEKEKHNGILSPDTVAKMETTYLRILKRGTAELRLLSPSLEGKGRRKQPPAKNLLDRLSAHQDHVLAFLHDPAIPFDNNPSERDIRMAKLKQKISGTFRSKRGSHTFCVIRSFISTVKKQGRNILSSIEDVISEQDVSLFSH